MLLNLAFYVQVLASLTPCSRHGGLKLSLMLVQKPDDLIFKKVYSSCSGLGQNEAQLDYPQEAEATSLISQTNVSAILLGLDSSPEIALLRCCFASLMINPKAK